jgi:apolipoprotein N-acyltransferase
MQLLPFMNITSRFLVPVFFEGICIVIAVVVYFFYTKKIQKYMYFQVVLIIVISIVFSFIIKTNFVPKKQQTSLECTIIQGGYSSQDYTLIETYPVLTEKLANRYLMHLEEVKNAKFIILPESAFPVKQKQDSSILQSIKGIACSRNEYILTSILLEEGMEVYNAAALINPQGQLQDVYKKRNVVLFVETSDFAKGKALPIFEIGNTKIAPMICFDVVFIRNYFRVKIPDVYIVTSNDIFAERTVLAQLHQSYAVINSRTMGIPLLQVMQNGPSFYVNSKGALTNLTKPYEKVIGLPVLIQ